jgi:hypothetical protein
MLANICNKLSEGSIKRHARRGSRGAAGCHPPQPELRWGPWHVCDPKKRLATYQSLKQSLPSRRTTRNHIPHPLFQLGQSQLLRHLCRRHCTRDVLLVGKHQEQRLLHLAVEDDAVQLLSCLVDARAVVGVDDEDEALRAGEVVAPQRSDLVLPTHVPHVELDVLVGYGFDVEADGGDRGDVLVQFELVEDCWRGG